MMYSLAFCLISLSISIFSRVFCVAVATLEDRDGRHCRIRQHTVYDRSRDRPSDDDICSTCVLRRCIVSSSVRQPGASYLKRGVRRCAVAPFTFSTVPIGPLKWRAVHLFCFLVLKIVTVRIDCDSWSTGKNQKHDRSISVAWPGEVWKWPARNFARPKIKNRNDAPDDNAYCARTLRDGEIKRCRMLSRPAETCIVLFRMMSTRMRITSFKYCSGAGFTVGQVGPRPTLWTEYRTLCVWVGSFIF